MFWLEVKADLTAKEVVRQDLAAKFADCHGGMRVLSFIYSGSCCQPICRVFTPFWGHHGLQEVMEKKKKTKPKPKLEASTSPASPASPASRASPAAPPKAPEAPEGRVQHFGMCQLCPWISPWRSLKILEVCFRPGSTQDGEAQQGPHGTLPSSFDLIKKITLTYIHSYCFIDCFEELLYIVILQLFADLQAQAKEALRKGKALPTVLALSASDSEAIFEKPQNKKKLKEVVARMHWVGWSIDLAVRSGHRFLKLFDWRFFVSIL